MEGRGEERDGPKLTFAMVQQATMATHGVHRTRNCIKCSWVCSHVLWEEEEVEVEEGWQVSSTTRVATVLGAV